MLSVAEARKRILSIFKPVETIQLPIDCLFGRILASDIIAPIDLPLFDNSESDGFALHASDVTGADPANPRTLNVVADIRAGTFSNISIEAGQCARIMTGASMPPGADAVVMVEDTDFNIRQAGTPPPEKVSVFKSIQVGDHIRYHGDDLLAGEKVLFSGTLLRAQEIGLLAMLGIKDVPVYRSPRVAILSSGDELLPVTAPIMPGKIYESNSYMLAALAEKAGVELIKLGVASDTEADVRAHLQHAVDERADVIISSAGVSMGAFDFVKFVVEADGELDFWKVDLRPGKPLAFGKYHGVPFFGLPGNPVSVFIGFEIFVRPALEKLSGRIPHSRPHQIARLVEPVESDGRASFLRGLVTEENGHLNARLTGHQGSGNIFSLVQANALLIVPSGVKSLPANSEIEIWYLE